MERKQQEDLISEFDQTAFNDFNVNCLEYYNTVYVAPDQASDYSHPKRHLQSLADRSHTSLHLHEQLGLSNNDIYFSDGP